MTDINKLTAVDSVTSGDLLPVFSTNNGGARKAALSAVLAYIQDNIVFPSSFTNQYAAPSATGFSVTVDSGSVWLVLTPTGAFAVGALVLPASPSDGDELLCNTTQDVTALTVSGNGNTVTGAPATLSANDFFRLRFEAVTSTWYRVG